MTYPYTVSATISRTGTDYETIRDLPEFTIEAPDARAARAAVVSILDPLGECEVRSTLHSVALIRTDDETRTVTCVAIGTETYPY